MAILDIRAGHGSGKSWIVHQLLSQFANEPLLDTTGKHLGYLIIEPECAIIGKYENVCGGCDQLGSPDEVDRRIRLLCSAYRNVLFEGMFVAHTYGRYTKLATDLRLFDYRFLFLETPLAVCISRVKKRRRERGDDRPFDPVNVILEWHKRPRVQAKMIADGHKVFVVPWEDPLPMIISMLGE